MATGNRTVSAGRGHSVRNSGEIYIEGNAARKLSQEQEIPRRQPGSPRRKEEPERTYRKAKPQRAAAEPRLSREAQQNRSKAMRMNRRFVLFIAGVSVAVLFFCIHYLRLKSDYTNQVSAVASLESELAQLKEDNDSYYSEVTSDADLEKIKKIAMGRLGMKNPTEEQTMTYSIEKGSYVRQYQEVPE